MGYTKVYHCLVKLYGDGLDFVFDTDTPDHDEYGVLTTTVLYVDIHMYSYTELSINYFEFLKIFMSFTFSIL